MFDTWHNSLLCLLSVIHRTAVDECLNYIISGIHVSCISCRSELLKYTLVVQLFSFSDVYPVKPQVSTVLLLINCSIHFRSDRRRTILVNSVSALTLSLSTLYEPDVCDLLYKRSLAVIKYPDTVCFDLQLHACIAIIRSLRWVYGRIIVSRIAGIAGSDVIGAACQGLLVNLKNTCVNILNV